MDLLFNEGVSAGLPDATRKQLEALCGWDFSSVRDRLRTRHGWPEAKARRVQREYLRFLALIILRPEKHYGMAGVVDEFWHEHLLDTLDYHRLCSEVIGRFVHHEPLPAFNGDHEGQPDAYADETFPALKANFRQVSPRLWPAPGGDGVRCGRCGKCRDGASDLRASA